MREIAKHVARSVVYVSFFVIQTGVFYKTVELIATLIGKQTRASGVYNGTRNRGGQDSPAASDLSVEHTFCH